MIRFENVGMRYDNDDEILSDINFELEAGSFHFLTGPSGAGKSSLLKLLYLAHRPSRGKITFFEQDIQNASRSDLINLRRRIGIVFQDFRLLRHLSALENVALPLQMMGGKRKEIQNFAEEILEWVGLKGKTRALPPTLSGGEKQRVAIARAVITKPQLLLADEPTGNVDPEMADRIMKLFVELNKMGTTTVIATHNPALVAKFQAPTMTIREGNLSYDK
ncbi:MAG: cell division ATP-binding protein FtsE [Alphaproteobacteria bacterium]|nr:MAG: cell division ATP-binding protein FtsE [Alphaproteobacteria bacterium]